MRSPRPASTGRTSRFSRTARPPESARLADATPLYTFRILLMCAYKPRLRPLYIVIAYDAVARAETSLGRRVDGCARRARVAWAGGAHRRLICGRVHLQPTCGSRSCCPRQQVLLRPLRPGRPGAAGLLKVLLICGRVHLQPTCGSRSCCPRQQVLLRPLRPGRPGAAGLLKVLAPPPRAAVLRDSSAQDA
jgi:hypothetical protein